MNLIRGMIEGEGFARPVHVTSRHTVYTLKLLELHYQVSVQSFTVESVHNGNCDDVTRIFVSLP